MSKYNCCRNRGQAIVLVAICIILLLAAAGIVIDAGHIMWNYRQLRNCCDAAALAAAQELPESYRARMAAADYYGKNTLKTLVWRDDRATTSRYTAADEEVFISSPFRDERTFVLGIPVNWAVEVRAKRSVRTFFVRVLGIDTYTVTTRSVAKGGGGWNTSILASSRTGDNGGGYSLELSGSSNNFDRPASTNHNFKITGSGNTGNVDYAGILKGNLISPNNTVNARYIYPMIPPYYDMAAYQGSATVKITGDHTFAPGEELNGLYFIDGNVKIQSRVSGTATIVATGEINIVGNNVDLQPYEEGPMLFFSGANIEISGRGHTLRGVFYAPNGRMNMAAAYANIYGGIVADLISFSASNVTMSYEVRYFPGEVKLIE